MNLCIFASGKGTNLKYLFKAQKLGKIKSKIRLVISNNSYSEALDFARANGIKAIHISQKLYPNLDSFANALVVILKKHKINLIVLAGYMKLLPSKVVSEFKYRILNVHPALIPSFCGQGYYGLKVHEEVINYGCKVTGATVHLVDEIYDHGAIVLQKAIDVEYDETPESLRAKVLKLENRLLLEAVKLFETKKFNIKERKVFFT